MLENVKKEFEEIYNLIYKELDDQRHNLKMIASENFASPAVLECMGTWLSDKYSEGYPYHRFYAGCDNIDRIEEIACDTACRVFGAEHAYVQPHSGADANLCAYWAILSAKVMSPLFKGFKEEYEKISKSCKNYNDLIKQDWDSIRRACHNQKLLGMDYYSGGHLTHGYRQNISAQLFNCYSYEVNEDGFIDYESIREQAKAIKPLILLAGYSAYPRKIDFSKFREIADEVGAVLMVDMSHFSGLVAGKVFTGVYNPVEYADIVTTTTHKTLRGPRGGMILCKNWLAEYVDKGCPLVLGGPLPHVMASKAITLLEAEKPEFKIYANNIVDNARSLGTTLISGGASIQTGGTDNHIILVDVNESYGLNGKQAEAALRECGITCNRNALPNDKNGVWYTSGVRLGTAALTTLGMGRNEMQEIGDIINSILANTKPIGKNKYELQNNIKEESKNRVNKLLNKFPLYKEWG